MIQINKVFKRYAQDGPNILENIDLSISPGEFVALIGPSGCGKSTLLKLIAGYDFPSSGDILMNDEPIKGASHKRAVVSQENTLFPWFNVEHNIAYGLKVRDVNKNIIKKRVDSILKEINLEKFRHHKVFELSGGMKQRVSLARTLVNDSELILMDEPLGALDKLTRTSMQNLISDLWKSKDLTVMMVTHDIEEALLLATRVIVFSKDPGKKIAEFHPNFDISDEVQGSSDFIDMKLEIMKLL